MHDQLQVSHGLQQNELCGMGEDMMSTIVSASSECACVHTCVQTGERRETERVQASTTDSTHAGEGKRTGRSHAGWKTKREKNTPQKRKQSKNMKGACVCMRRRG